MKQPDTSALRERLADYTPEQELKQDMQAHTADQTDQHKFQGRSLPCEISCGKQRNSGRKCTTYTAV